MPPVRSRRAGKRGRPYVVHADDSSGGGRDAVARSESADKSRDRQHEKEKVLEAERARDDQHRLHVAVLRRCDAVCGRGADDDVATEDAQRELARRRAAHGTIRAPPRAAGPRREPAAARALARGARAADRRRAAPRALRDGSRPRARARSLAVQGRARPRGGGARRRRGRWRADALRGLTRSRRSNPIRPRRRGAEAAAARGVGGGGDGGARATSAASGKARRRTTRRSHSHRACSPTPRPTTKPRGRTPPPPRPPTRARRPQADAAGRHEGERRGRRQSR